MRMKENSFYQLRCGTKVGPTERWNPVLMVAPLPVTFEDKSGPPHFTFMMDGESTWKSEYDAVKELKIR